MEISTDAVKALRDKTGVSVMQCRKALEEAGGDPEKALVILRKKGAEAAAKKADRTLGAGVVATYIHANQIGGMIELRSETDFVAKNEAFLTLANQIAQQVAATDPRYLSMNDIPEAESEKAKEVFKAELKGKPEALHEQILAGKLASYFKDQVLLEQDYIREPGVTIKGLIEAAVQKLGERIEISKIVRFSVR